MRLIWKGSISFGLVNVPVGLTPATTYEELKFRLLRASDLSPINYKRVAEADGREVPWDQIVKGYEYEKGRFVVLKEEDFARVDLEATQTIDILDFVRLEEVNPVYFHKPYYLQPQKGGERVYALLREVLRRTGKVGIAKVVIKTRQHLAAVKDRGGALMLELMHFADEILAPPAIKIASAKGAGDREVRMAESLVEQLTTKWDPGKYTDDYHSALMKLIGQKVKLGGKALPGAPRHPHSTPDNVVDLMAVLQKSLEHGGRSKPRGRAAAGERSRRRRAA